MWNCRTGSKTCTRHVKHPVKSRQWTVKETKKHVKQHTFCYLCRFLAPSCIFPVCAARFSLELHVPMYWQHVQHRCIFWIFYACSTTHTPNSFAVAILLFLLVSGARSLASIFRRLTFKNILFLFSLCYVPFVCSAYMFSALTSKRACFVVCMCCAVLLSTSKMFLFHLCYLMHEQNLCVIYNAMSNWWARWVSVREQSQRYGKHTPRIQIPNTRPRYIFFLFFFLVCCCCLCRNFSFFSLSFCILMVLCVCVSVFVS